MCNTVRLSLAWHGPAAPAAGAAGMAARPACHGLPEVPGAASDSSEVSSGRSRGAPWRTQRPSVPASGHRRASQRPGALTLGVRASRLWRAERPSVPASERLQSYLMGCSACGGPSVPASRTPGRRPPWCASQRPGRRPLRCPSVRPASGGLTECVSASRLRRVERPSVPAFGN